MLKKYLFGILYGFLLTAFTVYVLLDTFVISEIYQTVPSNDIDGKISQLKNSSTQGNAAESNNGDLQSVATANTYTDDNISISMTEYTKYNTSIYVADVRLASPEYLQTAFANGSYGKNVTAKTSEIAQRNNAILAVNGDYYGAQQNGYVIRNGILYRNTASRNQEDLVIFNDGSFGIVEEKSVSADDLVSDGAYQVLSFGPALVRNGAISVQENDEVGRAKTSNPRTAIGIIDKLHYIFVVSDGRTKESEGLSLYELAKFMQNLGTKIAYNLDGGGSSAMYFNGKIINNPTTNGKTIKERSVSDIVYIGY